MKAVVAIELIICAGLLIAASAVMVVGVILKALAEHKERRGKK